MVCDVHRNNKQDRRLCGLYRVMADGRDVTREVFYVDARRRLLGLYVKDSNGYFLFVDGDVAKCWQIAKHVRLVKKGAGNK